MRVDGGNVKVLGKDVMDTTWSNTSVIRSTNLDKLKNIPSATEKMKEILGHDSLFSRV